MTLWLALPSWFRKLSSDKVVEVQTNILLAHTTVLFGYAIKSTNFPLKHCCMVRWLTVEYFRFAKQ